MTTFERLLRACSSYNEDAGIVADIKREPLGGFNANNIMPPTYEGGKYQFQRRIGPDGKEGSVVTLDSMQSAANRCEIALLESFRRGEIQMPMVEVRSEFYGRAFTVLEVPHRIYDAIIRDSTNGGTDFWRTKEYEKLCDRDDTKVMPVVLQYNPVGLILGCWNSTSNVSSEKSFKFPRVMTVEVFGGLGQQQVDHPNLRHGVRICPVGITKSATVFVETISKSGKKKESDTEDKKGKKFPLGTPGGAGPWQAEEHKGLSPVPPSEINHGAILHDSHGGVSVQWVTERMSLSLHGLHRYNTGNAKKDAYVRVYLSALGLYMHAMRTIQSNYRSGCSLILAEPVTYRWAGPKSDPFTLGVKEVGDLYKTALKQMCDVIAFDRGLHIKLTTTEKVEKLIKQSNLQGE